MALQHDTFLIRGEVNQSRQLKLEESAVGYFEHYFRSNNFILLVPFNLRRTSANLVILKKNLIHQCDIVKRTMKKIVLQFDPKLMKGKAALVQIEGLLENFGIHGGFFFTFSYKLLGSVSHLNDS
ncbi:unnamed protein product [Orchesella dallaii]|uniref:Uncharacterized protein n=1 Tax=Orchesella dallaii TaxID=48710 RepID=A0ABP1RP26_9HEXA